MLNSCQTTQKKTEVELGANKGIEDVQVCHCDSLNMNDRSELMFKGEVFTGVCELYYPNSTNKYVSKQILNGKINGSIFYYDKEGNILVEEEYVNGKKIGEKDQILLVNCKDLSVKEVSNQKIYYYNEKPFTGTCQDFYPNSNQAYLVSDYKDGKLNGYTTYFNKDGSVLIMNKYKDNELVSEMTTSFSEIEDR